MAKIKITMEEVRKEGSTESNDELDLEIYNTEIGKAQWSIYFPAQASVVEDVEESFQELSQILFRHRIDLHRNELRQGICANIKYGVWSHRNWDQGIGGGFGYRLDIHLPEEKSLEEEFPEGKQLFHAAKKLFAQTDFYQVTSFEYFVNGDTLAKSRDRSWGCKNLKFQGWGPRAWGVRIESSFEYLPNKELIEWIAGHHRDTETFANIDYIKTARVIRKGLARENLKRREYE